MNRKYATHPYYGYFNGMIERGKKVGCDFPRGLRDFNKWLEAIGPIPEGMKRPSVGRYNHDRGYIFDLEMNRWNFRWQEFDENSGEEKSKSRKEFIREVFGNWRRVK